MQSDETEIKIPDFYTPNEELANIVTHGFGALLSVLGLIFLLVFARLYGDSWQLLSASIYGFSLLLLYFASTIYHGVNRPKAKSIFRRIDHASIYVLIAGSYTPFLLVSLRNVGGPWWFAIMWAIALVGIIYKLFFWGRGDTVSTIAYVLMGWMCIFFVRQMVANIAPAALWLLAAGGASYTLGVPMFALNKLPYNHAIWHLFVLGGSAFHYFAVLFYVVGL